MSGFAGTGPIKGISVFVAGYALVDLVPVLLPDTSVLQGLRVQDLADVLLVFLLVALYVRLGLQADLWRSWSLRGLNALALVMMVQGHSIHLAANAIAGDLGVEGGGLADGGAHPGASFGLIDFLDEHWGHTELHLAFLIMAALFIARSRPVRDDSAVPRGSAGGRVELLVAAFVYGVLLAGDAVEGQTVPLMLPAGIALCVWGLWPYLSGGSRSAERAPVSLHRRFFAVSLAVAAASLLVYGLVMRGYPQFSAL
ncbi:MAG: hypothetical protein JSV41_10065 [Gemmatimonadota bacterium]|nr:MAG: hypothetical protein JSV41_10065 [Gemmatimonadota bacterium]